MLDTANMRLIRRASSTLCAASLVALIGACTHPAPPDASAPRSWVVENLAGKSTAELYAPLIGPDAVFELSHSQIIDKYTVERGKLKMADASEGSLVTVRSSDGSLTALVNKTGVRGLLHIDSRGVSTFNPEPVVDPGIEDTVVNLKEKVVSTSADGNTAPKVINVLIGYSQEALNAVGGDATANALAQIASANLALQNSLISGVSMQLAGTQVVAIDYPLTSETLEQLPNILATGISSFDPDVIYGIFMHKGEMTLSWATSPGRTAIGNQFSTMVFAHTLGHNAGSASCNTNGADNYRFGYDNGKSGSLLCGVNRTLYYSTPALTDQYGLPRGNAVTADTARVWRENAARLSSYATSRPKNFRKTGSTAVTVTFSWDPSPEAVRYEIYYTSPTIQNPVKVGGVTGLTYTASVISERTIFYVKAVGSTGVLSGLSNGASR